MARGILNYRFRIRRRVLSVIAVVVIFLTRLSKVSKEFLVIGL